MSSKKITDADKLEIVDLYRQSGETTASLANRYGVSNSTISRLLKTSIAETEYEILIQQKRGIKAGGDEEISVTTDEPKIVVAPIATPPELEIADRQQEPHPDSEPAAPLIAAPTVPTDLIDLVVPSAPISTSEDIIANNRRVRRRSSAPIATASDEPPAVANSTPTSADPLTDRTLDGKGDKIDFFATDELPPPKTIIPSPIPRTPVLREILSDSQDRYFKPPVAPSPLEEIPTIDESDEDTDPEDVNTLAAMFGEEIADGEDEEEDDGEDWDEDSVNSGLLDRNQLLTSDRLHVQVTPLSQATLPRTCYIVIDKFAELIVRPLKDFADLGQISTEETQQRTLPVFDNHRVAKRFSNQRTQRVIKVPDSRVFYKTSEHLRSKGIACLLVDGNIYSLN
jgi:transposase-like protein